MTLNIDEIVTAASKWLSTFPITKFCGDGTQRFTYGTAGFRVNCQAMELLCARAGLVSVLRSIQRRMSVGLVITASHNAWTDNGIKIIDPEGGMLSVEWEPFANELVNFAASDEDLRELIVKIMGPQELVDSNTETISSFPQMLVGYDTRIHNPRNAAVIQKACQLFNGRCLEVGYTTTPQIHYLTHLANTNYELIDMLKLGNPLALYFKHFSSALLAALNSIEQMDEHRKMADFKIRAIVDAANGIGGPMLNELASTVKESGIDVEVKVVNNLGEQIINLPNSESCEHLYTALNERCGADYIKTNELLPQEFLSLSDDPRNHWLSFDGDADRILYFLPEFPLSSQAKVDLLDGDRICALCALYITHLSRQLPSRVKPTIAVVQTAYSNGNCTRYIKEKLALPIIMTATGVKNLHLQAQRFDIGIYFEANGHGTILFDENFLSILRDEIKTGERNRERDTCRTLLALSDLVNQQVGDAMSLFLTIELILFHLGLTDEAWYNLYGEQPNRLGKWTCRRPVDGDRRSQLVVTGAKCRCVEPEALAKELEHLHEANRGQHMRAFVRKSGTEEIVRIYVEADNITVVDSVMNQISELLDKLIIF